MKISTKRRWLSLLLAFLMVLTLTPTALLEGEGDGQTPPATEDPDGDGSGSTPETPDTGPIKSIELRSDSSSFSGQSPNYTITLEPNSSESRGIPITVVTARPRRSSSPGDPATPPLSTCRKIPTTTVTPAISTALPPASRR